MAQAITYQTAKVSDDVELGFLDSWQHLPAPDRPGSYKTIIAVHGLGFNSSVWFPLLELVPRNVRFVAFNQRGYAHSSPALQTKEGKVAAAACALDALDFFKFAVDELKVPGGVTVLGWSKGASIVLSVIAALGSGPSPDSASFLASLPVGLDLKRQYSFWETRIESVVLYDTPAFALGQDVPYEFMAPLLAVFPPNEATPLELGETFGNWIASYSGPEEETEGLPASGIVELAQLAGEGALEPLAVGVGFLWELGPPEESERLTKQIILGEVGRVRIGHVYGSNTAEPCKTGERTIRRWAEENGKEVRVAIVPRANHFAMLLRPAEFWKAVEQLM